MSVSYIPDESPFADRTALEQWARENLDELRNDDHSVTYVSVTTDSVADGAFTQLYWTGEHQPEEYTASWNRLFALDNQSLIRSFGASPPNLRFTELGLDSAVITVFDNLSNQILGDKAIVQYSKLLSDDYTRTSFSVFISLSEYQWSPQTNILRIAALSGFTGPSLNLMNDKQPGDYIRIYEDDDNILECRVISSFNGDNMISYTVAPLTITGSFLNNV